MARENDFELSDYVNPDGSLKFGPKADRARELLAGAEPTPQEELEMEMGGGDGELSEDEYQRIFGMPEHPSDTWEEHRGER